MTRLTLRVFIKDNTANFEVKDNGCGIKPKYLETLFTGYHSSENEISDSKKKNTGTAYTF
jgi:signal transduction histidine kinase